MLSIDIHNFHKILNLFHTFLTKNFRHDKHMIGP